MRLTPDFEQQIREKVDNGVPLGAYAPACLFEEIDALRSDLTAVQEQLRVKEQTVLEADADIEAEKLRRLAAEQKLARAVEILEMLRAGLTVVAEAKAKTLLAELTQEK